MDDFNKYIDTAKGFGAINAREFTIDEIVFDPRTILKCKYGCTDYGKLHNCPSDPKTLDIEQSIRIFKLYKRGVIIHAHSKTITQRASFEVERQAFLDGYHFAVSLSDCALCKECKGMQSPCANVRMARPALHSVGIDVFTTAKNMGLPLFPLHDEGDEENWYAGVFIE